mgnify:CR=1 FL=1
MEIGQLAIGQCYDWGKAQCTREACHPDWAGKCNSYYTRCENRC